MVPTNMIQRVEVLTDGASAVYGSDAVAGVINFVTRSSYDGLLVAAQTGTGDQYTTFGASLLWGTHWTGGDLIFGATLTQLGGIPYNFTDSRTFLNPNHIPQGGTNYNTFFCSPATIQVAGQQSIYLSAAATTPVANTNANSPCPSANNGYLVTPDNRTNGMIKLSQQVGDRLTINADAVYSYHTLVSPTAVGTIQATVFKTGPQANPFFQAPAGDPGATKETVRVDLHPLLAPGVRPTSVAQTLSYYFYLHPEYMISDNFRLTASAIYAGDNNFVGSNNTLCASCAYQALNGTTNTSGNLTTPSVVDTSIYATTLPLTPDNALDVWNPVSGNLTSDAEKARLTQNYSVSRWFYTTQDYKLGADGQLFDLPAGPVSIAVGGEATRYALNIEKTASNNTGPMTPTSGAGFLKLNLQRTVMAAYGEVLLPVIGPSMNIPLMDKLTFDLSARYDHYSDVGATSNPKVGVDWVVTDGIKLRASWASSFVAPELSSIGDRSKTGPGGVGGGLTTFTGYSTASSSFTVPQAFFPMAALVPGVTCAGGTCAINGGSVQGISFNGGPDNPKPSRGRSWSVGVDISPSLLPGFDASVSLFNTAYINGITGSSLANGINSPSLGTLTFYPSGATQAQIQAVTGPYAVINSYPATIYYIASVQQQNILNLNVQGIDMSTQYDYETENLGGFTFGASLTQFLLFKQHIKGGPTFSVLGSTGYNNTFPSIASQARFSIGWLYEGFSASLHGHFVGGHHNWSSSTVNPVLLTPVGTPMGGGDVVKSNLTFDLHLSYTMDELNVMGADMGGSEIFLDVVNIADKAPVFYNGLSGYDSYSGNPIGRVVTVGVRARFN
jgi:iron complex outermembrane receptor protein